MSQFDTAMACTRNMLECLTQNHFETPPYGPVPDATRKLRTAVTTMIDALVIAMDAESRGYELPPVPVMPEVETESFKTSLRAEHTLHREHAAKVALVKDAEPEPQVPQVPQVPEVPEPEHRRGTRREEAAHAER